MKLRLEDTINNPNFWGVIYSHRTMDPKNKHQFDVRLEFYLDPESAIFDLDHLGINDINEIEGPLPSGTKFRLKYPEHYQHMLNYLTNPPTYEGPILGVDCECIADFIPLNKINRKVCA